MRRWASIAIALPVILAMPALAQTGPSFDCRKATSGIDRAICGDAALAGQDRELADRYRQLSQTVSPAGRAVLQTKQRDWLRARDDCTKDRPREEMPRCLTEAYTTRIDELNTQYSASGSLAIEQRVAARLIPRWRVDEAQSYPWLTGTPPARVDAFNRYIAQRLQLAKGLFAASGMKLDAKPDGDTTFSRFYTVHRLDDRLISLAFQQYHQSYIGHAWRSEFAINWDLRRDRPLRTQDIFRADQDWQKVVYDFAIRQLREEGEISKPESWFNQAEVDDDDAWLFGDAQATLMLGHGERSLAGASAEVSIPYDVLRPLLRADTPAVPR